MVIVNIPGSLVVSYLGGCFGNSLVAAILMAKNNVQILPSNENFHDYTNWVIQTPSEMITMNSDIKLHRWPESSTDIMQVHCLNTLILKYKFPSSRRILLTCPLQLEKYAIHRQWRLLNDQNQDVKTLSLNAWDWITYNCQHYKHTGRNFDDNGCLCIDFRKIAESWTMIENFLDIDISLWIKKIYQSHIDTQMEKFYSVSPAFAFAWTAYQQKGVDAPIEDLIHEVQS